MALDALCQNAVEFDDVLGSVGACKSRDDDLHALLQEKASLVQKLHSSGEICAKFSRKLRVISDENDSLRSQLKNEVAELEKEKREVQKAAEDLRKQLDAKERELQLSNQSKAAALQEAESLRIEKSSLDAVVVRLQESRDRHDSQRNEAFGTVEALQEELQQLKSQMDQLKNQQRHDLDASQSTQLALEVQLCEAAQQLQLTSDALNRKEKEAKDASEEAGLTILQLNQVQEELESISLVVEELRQQLEVKGGELQKVARERDAREKEKGEAQQQLAELKQQLHQNAESLAEKESAAKDASEKAEFTLIQLHQVQEELEHYFLDSRSKEELLQQYSAQAQDMRHLLSDLIHS